MVPIIAYRVEEEDTGPQALDAARAVVPFPLSPLPSLDDIAAERADYDERLAAAEASGDLGRIKPAMVAARWGRATEELVRSGAPATPPLSPINAVRIGDGAIVTGPGEVFTEIGLAVKERSPGRPTAYAGYTNGMVGYLPIASEYPYGGYEPGTSHRGYELPSAVSPDCDELLVRTGVRLAEGLFPGAAAWDGERGWLASGDVPALPDDGPPHPGGAGMPGEPQWSTGTT